MTLALICQTAEGGKPHHMHILLLTHNFSPEVNAPANRGYDHARQWIERGHRVTVVTGVPNHPHGRIYPGYRNRLFQREVVDGIDIIRLGTWVSANSGRIGRTLNFLSYMLAVFLWQWRLPKSDIVVSTSPQFFCGLSGWFLQRKSRPWVLEIRDLWPESIVAVGAMKRGVGIRLVEALEAFVYRRADLVVSVTDSFLAHIGPKRGDKPMVVIRNGVIPGALESSPDDVAAFRSANGLTDKFVAAYVGTHGMAHALDTALDAAALLRDRSDIAFLLVGDGAERERLVAARAQRGLDNVVMLGLQPRSAMPVIWGATDAALVLLRRSDTFLSVLPSKMFEAMAAAKPVLLGVAGEAKAMLDHAESGIAVPPEDAVALAAAVIRLADDDALAARLGQAGQRYFATHLDRRALADQMLDAMIALKSP